MSSLKLPVLSGCKGDLLILGLRKRVEDLGCTFMNTRDISPIPYTNSNLKGTNVVNEILAGVQNYGSTQLPEITRQALLILESDRLCNKQCVKTVKVLAAQQENPAIIGGNQAYPS